MNEQSQTSDSPKLNPLLDSLLPANSTKESTIDKSVPNRLRGRASTIPLPSIRILFHRCPGLALDAYLPFSRHLHCYMSAESYFGGSSSIKFGLQPLEFPFLRLQLTPNVQVSIRIPFLRFFKTRQLEVGATFLPHEMRNGNGFADFCKMSFEFRQRNSFLDMVVGEKSRRQLAEMWKEGKEKLKDTKGMVKDEYGSAQGIEKILDGIGEGYRIRRPVPDKPYGGLDPSKRTIESIPDLK